MGAILLAGATASEALEVRSVRWGFTNVIHEEAFNLCTLQIANDDPVPFNGPLTLNAVNGGSRLEDVPSIMPDVYIGASETRIVQFVVYITGGYQNWQLQYGQFNERRAELPQMPGSMKAQEVVQLRSSRDVSANIEGISVFDEADFPSGAPGTAGLGTVVLDHVPRWDVARRQAFRDWLGAGGTLYLLHARDGSPTTGFGAPLEELNIPADRFTVGQGVVLRHVMITSSAQISTLAAAIQAGLPNPTDQNNYSPSSGMGNLLSSMREMVRPDHNWVLIFFLSVVYLLILFPGVWLYSRKRGDYRITYGLVLGTVVLFSVFFAEIGKHGYDDKTTLQTAIVARPLGNGRVLLNLYSNQFVTAGGERPLVGFGESSAFTLDPGTSFSGSATVFQRPQAGLTVDIPPYSSCSYHESTVRTVKGDYSIQTFLNESGPGTLRFKLGTAFPKDAEVYLQVDRNVAQLTPQGTEWILSGGWQSLQSRFHVEESYAWRRIPESEQLKNQRGLLIGLGTGQSMIQNNQWQQQAVPVGPTTPTAESLVQGTLLVMTTAPEELRPEGAQETSPILFVHPVNAAAIATPPPTTEAAPPP